jgi:hypothetical protein
MRALLRAAYALGAERQREKDAEIARKRFPRSGVFTYASENAEAIAAAILTDGRKT